MASAQMRIGVCQVDDFSPPYIIAEIGVNHGGSLAQAKRLIELAWEGGAQAAKFQTYKADKLASRNSPAYWDTSREPTRSQYALFQKYDAFGPDEYRLLAEHCAHLGIDFVSTPFDTDAVDFLAPLVPCFKIASADLTNIPLLRKVARQGKPVVLSTGASTLAEIDTAVEELRRCGCASLALLHCVLNYPTAAGDAHLGMIRGLRRAYPDLVIGYSDHTLPDSGMLSLTSAYLLGARIIEKHFTHDKTLPGNDHYHAMDSGDLKRLVTHLNQIRDLIGATDAKRPLASEQGARENARRSVVLAQKLEAGTIISENMLTCKRPGTGISPLYWDGVIGRRVSRALNADHVLQWEDLSAATTNSSERVVAAVQARMGSTRFPGKMMALLDGRPLMEWILSRVRRSEKLDQVVLVTSADKENDALEQIGTRMGIRTIRGDEHDVLSRFVTAARECSADWIVRICGDNPFVDPAEIDRLVEFTFMNRPDYAFNHRNLLSNAYADGFGAEILSRTTLETVDRDGTKPHHREHVTSFIWDNPHPFRILTLPAPPNIAFEHLRFDVDNPQDLARLQALASTVGIDGSAQSFVEAELSRSFQSI